MNIGVTRKLLESLRFCVELADEALTERELREADGGSKLEAEHEDHKKTVEWVGQLISAWIEQDDKDEMERRRFWYGEEGAK